MSFGDSFDAYCVIYAPHIDGHRRERFEAELARIGVEKITLIEAKRVEPNDPRLVPYANAYNPAGFLSLADAIKTVIHHAEEKGWESVVIMESDILFRKNFNQLWNEVEPEVKGGKWDVLTLYRRSQLLIIESPLEKTRLLPMTDNACNHCVIIRRACYAPAQVSLDYCIQKGQSSARSYGILYREFGRQVFATSKNLAGQAGGGFSSLSKGTFPYNNFYASFRACRSPIEYLLVRSLYYLHQKLRKAFRPAT